MDAVLSRGAARAMRDGAPRLVDRRPRVLLFARYYLPGFKAGGPIRTISNIVQVLGSEIEFSIYTGDRDILDSQEFSSVSVGRWNGVGGASVFYAPKSSRSIRRLSATILDVRPDMIYLNSFFDPEFTLRPIIAARLVCRDVPILIAPRGELAEGALSLKRWKKSAFRTTALRLGVYNGAHWHASSEFEKLDICHMTGATADKVHVAPNIFSPVWPSAVGNSRNWGPLRVVFLSRIARNKNLRFALEVLSACKVSVEFDIWGTVEDPVYWNQCEVIVGKLPRNIRATYCGVADQPLVTQILSQYDLLFLPTEGENFGHVIAESLSVGTPVLISDMTPWRNLQACGVGWDLPLSEGMEMFVDAIGRALERRNRDGTDWRRQVIVEAEKRLRDPGVIAANRRLFRQVAASTRKNGAQTVP